MKKQMVVLVAVAGLTGLFAITSLTFAGGTRVAQVRKTAPVEVATAEEIWKQEFDSALETDNDYLSAMAAVEDYTGNDDAVYDNLVAAQDKIYMEIALAAYEDIFGTWQGSEKEFDDYVSYLVTDPLVKCIELATEACKSSGGVKDVEQTTNGKKSICKFSCYPKVVVN